MQANLSFLQAEEATALNCSRAWVSLRKFESYFPNMFFGAELNELYCSSRGQCLALSKGAAEASGLNEGIALDAILLLDRLMHQTQDAFSEVHKLPALFPTMHSAHAYVYQRCLSSSEIPCHACVYNVCVHQI